MKKTPYLALMAVLLSALPSWGDEKSGNIEKVAELKAGYQVVGDVDSAKFNEYRDIRDGAYLYRLGLSVFDKSSRRYFDFTGTRLFRDDQNALLSAGVDRKWRIELEWDETPHLFSNKARTPYDYQGGGLFTVSATAGVDMTTAGASTAKDTDVADYLAATLHDTALGTQREKARAAFHVNATQDLSFNIEASVERKEGFEVTGAAIGDRPPRAMNTQITEPVDYRTRELNFKTEYVKELYQVQLSYHLSSFENEVDSFTWENIFYNPTSGTFATVEDGGTDRAFSTIGRTSLYPDNIYQNVMLSGGINLPKDSRLNATVSYSLFDQNENLLPYSASSLGTDWDSLGKLPRASADASMDAVYLKADYSITPVGRLGLHAFYSYYGLDNETKTDEWYYATQDAADSGGGVNVNNQRKNLAYSYAKQNYGVDAYYPLRSVRLGGGYEREEVDRDFREADTGEDMLKASLSTRLAGAVSLSLKYLYGDRVANGYNGEVTDESYHFSNAVESGNDRPYGAFGNHPDLRKFDVADRKRSQFDISASAEPMSDLTVSASYSLRKDNYDSDVLSSQPLAGTGYASEAGTTPGDQLGLLKEERRFYSVDASYVPDERLRFGAFYSKEKLRSTQRGIAFDENKRVLATYDWNQAAKQWMATTDDKTDTVGLSVVYVIIPEKLSFKSDYTYSFGTVDIRYTGYGTGLPLDSNTYYYAFADPEKVSHTNHVVNATLEYQAMRNVVVGLSYVYDRYKIKDWMQEPSGGWVEEVDSEFLLRDSSEDTRWGNRLVTLGSLLGPSYEAHVGTVTVAYSF